MIHCCLCPHTKYKDSQGFNFSQQDYLICLCTIGISCIAHISKQVKVWNLLGLFSFCQFSSSHWVFSLQNYSEKGSCFFCLVKWTSYPKLVVVLYHNFLPLGHVPPVCFSSTEGILLPILMINHSPHQNSYVTIKLH